MVNFCTSGIRIRSFKTFRILDLILIFSLNHGALYHICYLMSRKEVEKKTKGLHCSRVAIRYYWLTPLIAVEISRFSFQGIRKKKIPRKHCNQDDRCRHPDLILACNFYQSFNDMKANVYILRNIQNVASLEPYILRQILF